MSSVPKAVPDLELDDVFTGAAEDATSAAEKKSETQKELVGDVISELRQQVKEIEKDREEWADVEPIPLVDEGDFPVVSIDYHDDYREAMAYFRAVMKAQEMSHRALALTAELIALNSANYTAWNYRRLCLEALGMSMEEELDFVDATADENPKNYQLWHHRGTVARKVGAAAVARELAFTSMVLEEDAKNYHAWAHRQKIVGMAGNIWEDEVTFSERHIALDVRNNSAWNQKVFALTHLPGGLSAAVRRREVGFASTQVSLAPHNESSWTYARFMGGVGFGRPPSWGGAGAEEEEEEEGIKEDLREIAESTLARHPDCTFALALQLDLAECAAGAGDGGGGGEEAAALCRRLAEADPVRKRYWDFRGGAGRV